jgi:hypothetical protein
MILINEKTAGKILDCEKCRSRSHTRSSRQSTVVPLSCLFSEKFKACILDFSPIVGMGIGPKENRKSTLDTKSSESGSGAFLITEGYFPRLAVSGNPSSVIPSCFKRESRRVRIWTPD